MTQLRIEQNSSAIETVSESVILKLYNTAIEISEPEAGLNDNAYMSGHISVPRTYRSYVEYLAGSIGEGTSGVVTSLRQNAEGRFLDLRIDVTNGYYAYFEDPVFRQACINKYSADGVGVTEASLAAVSSPSNLITSNDVWTSSLGDKTAVTSLEGFKYFSGIINDDHNVVNDFANATKIVFPSVTFTYYSSYTLRLVQNCPNLLDIDYQNAVFSAPNTGKMYVIDRNYVITEWDSSLIPNQTNFRNIELFNSWTKLKKVIFPEGVTATADRCCGCRSLLYIEYPTTITDMGFAWDFGRDSGHNIPAMVIKAVTPPDWMGYNPNDLTLGGRGFGWDLFPTGIYVPDNSVTAYKSFVSGGTTNEQAWASDYIKDRIRPLSELPLIYREMGTVTQADIDRV